MLFVINLYYFRKWFVALCYPFVVWERDSYGPVKPKLSIFQPLRKKGTAFKTWQPVVEATITVTIIFFRFSPIIIIRCLTHCLVALYGIVQLDHHWFRSWWRHQMETLSALLAICAGNSPVSGEFPVQRPVTRSFDIFFDLRLNKRLSKQSWRWWIETQPHPLWRHHNGHRTAWPSLVQVMACRLS